MSNKFYRILGQGATVGEGPTPSFVIGNDAKPGQTIVALSDTDSYWADLPITAGVTFAGDLSGNNMRQTVIGINGASVPAGPLTIGNVLQVEGSEQLYYAPVDLSGGSNYIQGVLPPGNCPIATNSSMGILELSGDFGGSASSPLVIGLQGTPILNTTPTTNQVLQYNGIEWEPQTLSFPPAPTYLPMSGDVDGYTNNNIVEGLDGYSILPIEDGYLNWNGTSLSWNPITFPPPITFLPMSGDVDGYTNASVVVALYTIPLSPTTPITNQVLQYNGSAWSPATLPTQYVDYTTSYLFMGS